MKTILLALLAAPAWGPSPAQAQVPCTGWSLDNEIQAYVVSGNGIGLNGDLIVSYTDLDPASSLGGVSLHRVLPDGTGVTLVDSFAQSGIGIGFASYVVGCAVSDDGTVLLARKRALPLPVDLIQLRRNGSVWTASSMPASGASSAVKSRHFHSDGNTAVLAATTTGPGSSRVIIDFLAVDPVTGDWFIEDTARGPFAFFGYAIGDVTVRGGQAVIRFAYATRALAFERTASGRWSEVTLPVDVVGPTSDMLQLVLDDDSLVSLHGQLNAPRLEVRQRGTQGQWTVLSVTPIASAPIEGLLQLHVAGDRIALQTGWSEFEVYRRTSPTTLALESRVDGGSILRLEDSYATAFVSAGAQFGVNVLPFDELATGLMPCFTAGRNICTGQRGGALRYLPGSNGPVDQVLLTDAPPESLAVLFGQRGFFEPVQPTLAGLCLSNVSVRATVPPIRTAQDGSGTWQLDPTNLMGPFGSTSFAGSVVAFQSLVRTPLGVASTDAVWVQL